MLAGAGWRYSTSTSKLHVTVFANLVDVRVHGALTFIPQCSNTDTCSKGAMLSDTAAMLYYRRFASPLWRVSRTIQKEFVGQWSTNSRSI